MQTKYAGYMGKVIMVDLTTETVSEYPWSCTLAAKSWLSAFLLTI